MKTRTPYGTIKAAVVQAVAENVHAGELSKTTGIPRYSIYREAARMGMSMPRSPRYHNAKVSR